jgi:hypothetical protein
LNPDMTVKHIDHYDDLSINMWTRGADPRKALSTTKTAPLRLRK